MKLLSRMLAIANRVLAAALLLFLATPAFAVLGDNAASVLSDQARMKGTLRSVDHRAYVMHEITMSSGSKVREFVSPAGAVFAVTWEGQFPPNFRQLLGPYYEEAQRAAVQKKATSAEQPPRVRRGPVVINTPEVVFVQTGHTRSFHGQAYIPQLMPQGVQASDIR